MSRAGSVSARVLCLMFNPYACTHTSSFYRQKGITVINRDPSSRHQFPTLFSCRYICMGELGHCSYHRGIEFGVPGFLGYLVEVEDAYKAQFHGCVSCTGTFCSRFHAQLK